MPKVFVDLHQTERITLFSEGLRSILCTEKYCSFALIVWLKGVGILQTFPPLLTSQPHGSFRGKIFVEELICSSLWLGCFGHAICSPSLSSWRCQCFYQVDCVVTAICACWPHSWRHLYLPEIEIIIPQYCSGDSQTVTSGLWHSCMCHWSSDVHRRIF
jgi:hypothetical protein